MAARTHQPCGGEQSLRVAHCLDGHVDAESVGERGNLGDGVRTDLNRIGSAEFQRLGAAVGLAVTPENGTLNHKLRTVVVDAKGRIEKVFPGNEWTAAELVDALKSAAAEE